MSAERGIYSLGRIHTVRVNGYDWPLERVLVSGATGWRLLGSEEPEDAWLVSLDVAARRIQRRIAEGKITVAGVLDAAPQGSEVRRPGEIPCTTCRRPTPLAELRGAPGRWTCTTCAAPAAPTGADSAPTEEDEMGRGRPMTDGELEVLRELRRAGQPLGQIAVALGRTESTIYAAIRRLERAGEEFPPVTRPGRSRDTERDARIAEAIAAGASAEEVAKAEGIHPSTVRRALSVRELAEEAPKKATKTEQQEGEDMALSEEDRKLIVEKLQQGWPLQQIATMAGVRIGVVREIEAELRASGATAPLPAAPTVTPCEHGPLVEAATELVGMAGLVVEPGALARMLQGINGRYDEAAARLGREHEAQLASAQRAAEDRVRAAEAQVVELRAASDRAQRDLRHEIDQLLIGIEEAQGRADAAEAARDEATARIAELEEAARRTPNPSRALIQAQEEVARLRESMRELEEGAAEAVEEAQALRGRLEDAEVELLDLRGRLAASKSGCSRLTDERDRALERANAVGADLAALREEHARLCAELAADREARTFAERHLADTCLDLDHANEAVEDLRAQLDAAHAARDSALDDVADLARRLTLEEAATTDLRRQLDHAKADAAEADKLRGLLDIAKRQLAERPAAADDGPYRRHWLAQRERRRAAEALEAARERDAEAAAELEEAEVEAERAALRGFMSQPEMPRKLAAALQGVADAAATMMGVAP